MSFFDGRLTCIDFLGIYTTHKYYTFYHPLIVCCEYINPSE